MKNDLVKLGKDYQFLQENEKLKDKLCYLTYSGSVSYGTNTKDSDIDIRGVIKNSIEDILNNKELDSYEDSKTDTVIYGLRKFITLCKNCNPSVIELLATKENHIIYINEAGKLLRDNIDIFLSKKAFVTFSGYAIQQLRRLENALAHDNYDENKKLEHIKKSIDSLIMVNEKEYKLAGQSMKFYIKNGELYIDCDIKSMSLRKFNQINSDIHNMLRNYDKLNNRNKKKDDKHLYKHAMHLIRLYLTGIDILSGNGVITYREKDLDLLQSIRNQEVSLDYVFQLADKLESKIHTAYENTNLPDHVDENKINELILKIYNLRD